MSAKGSNAWTPKNFVQFELDDKQNKACKAWNLTLEELDDLLFKLSDEDYQFSLRYDSYGKCEGAWMQKRGDKGHNAGLILAGRGSTPLKALRNLLFKHSVLDGEWPAPDVKIGERRIEIDD